MKVLLIILAITTYSNLCQAQSLIASELKEDIKNELRIDSFAIDANDNLCAAIVVKTEYIPNIHFSGMIIGTPKYADGNYVIFMSGAKRLRYNHENYVPGTIEWPNILQPGKVYSVSLKETSSGDTIGQEETCLKVTSSPKDLDVYIDGKKVGKTPYTTKELWAGKYKIQVKDGKGNNYTKVLDIHSGLTSSVNASFSDKVPVNLTFNCHVIDNITIDGVPYGRSIPHDIKPYLTYRKGDVELWMTSHLMVELLPGNHEIKIESEGYETQKVKIDVDKTVTTLPINITPSVKKETIYVQNIPLAFCRVQRGYLNSLSTVCDNTYVTYYVNNRRSSSIVVNLTKDFYLLSTEVTRKLWNAVMNLPSDISNSQYPITNVSYYDCKRFIERLNKITGKSFRLPTIIEWQYACQGGIYKDEVKTNSWIKDNSNGIVHKVAQSKPNLIGLYDMAGNVAEICESWYAQKVNVPDFHLDDYKGNTTGDEIVVGGFSYATDVKNGHKSSETINRTSPSQGAENYGFRLILEH